MLFVPFFTSNLICSKRFVHLFLFSILTTAPTLLQYGLNVNVTSSILTQRGSLKQQQQQKTTLPHLPA